MTSLNIFIVTSANSNCVNCRSNSLELECKEIACMCCCALLRMGRCIVLCLLESCVHVVPAEAVVCCVLLPEWAQAVHMCV
jgi:hypothetical protein